MKAVLLRYHLKAHFSLSLHAACWKVPGGLQCLAFSVRVINLENLKSTFFFFQDLTALIG